MVINLSTFVAIIIILLTLGNIYVQSMLLKLNPI